MNIENRMTVAETDYEYYARMQKETEEKLAWEEDNYDYWEEREKEEW